MNCLCLFDVDGTLTYPRKNIEPDMIAILERLHNVVDIGIIGGSNLAKIKEQLGNTDNFDFVFAENGLDAHFRGKELESETFISKVGEEKYKTLVNFILRYIADLDIPKKRGTFVEFRKGMINISPVGRNTTHDEREEYENFEKEHQIHREFIKELKRRFSDYGLAYSCGSCSSIDIYPIGWDKSFCLRHIDQSGTNYERIYFFGDKTYKGGNDYEIASHERVTSFTVSSPIETMEFIDGLFFSNVSDSSRS